MPCVLQNMDGEMKQRMYKCNICNWEGTDPKETEVIEIGNEGVYKVCPKCFFDKNIPTMALVFNLDIYSYNDN